MRPINTSIDVLNCTQLIRIRNKVSNEFKLDCNTIYTLKNALHHTLQINWNISFFSRFI